MIVLDEAVPDSFLNICAHVLQLDEVVCNLTGNNGQGLL